MFYSAAVGLWMYGMATRFDIRNVKSVISLTIVGNVTSSNSAFIIFLKLFLSFIYTHIHVNMKCICMCIYVCVCL